VRLMVVVLEEALVRGLQRCPRRRFGVVVVGHAAHHVEVGLNVVRPRLALINLLFPNSERGVDRLGVLGFEDAAAAR
jgi:hypothetical protein